ncbi:thioesterase family protein [Mycolicibacterium sp.]|uniref:acyl-CoA thioesterase n=1 Tax=Mycolicibacterium sp. TaxID=2320850 RepID=UPI0028AEEFD6|nr:thioesterase family protein [Mycolicibacterium sp.]
MSPDAHFAMPLRVRYAECDMQGRVFNGHYLTWVDMAHTEALRAMFGGYQALIDRGIDFVVVAAELQFRTPARFDDDLVVNVAIEPPGRTSLRSRYRIERGDDLIAEAALTHVCVDAASFGKLEWPDWFRDRLASAGTAL